MQRMRSQIEQLQSELLLYKGDTGGAFDELQVHHNFRKFLKLIPPFAECRFLMSCSLLP